MEEPGEMALPAGFGAARQARARSARLAQNDEPNESGRATSGDTDDEQARTAFLEDAVERWGDTVLGLAVRRTGNRADADDVFQTVFLRLHQSGKRFRDDEHLKAWLLHVTSNCCNDLHRSPWRRRRAALEDEDVARLAERPAPPEAEEDGDLEAALARLTDRQRAAVHLHYYEGYATDEIAQITGERPATVRSHLHRARKALKIDLGARP